MFLLHPRRAAAGAYRRLRSLVTGEGVVNYRGRGVVNLIDIGSFKGLPETWYRYAEQIRFLLAFEPRDAPLREANRLVMNVAVADSNGERPFYIYRGNLGAGSSLFRQNFDYVRANYEQLRTRGPRQLAETWFERSTLVRETTLRCRRLDDLLAELELPFTFQFLKIDAQGAEHLILQGAERFLVEHCLGLQLELFTIPLYEGITLLPEVVAYLDGLGFDLVKQMPAHGSFDSQHDCVFLKRGATGPAVAAIKRVYQLT